GERAAGGGHPRSIDTPLSLAGGDGRELPAEGGPPAPEPANAQRQTPKDEVGAGGREFVRGKIRRGQRDNAGVNRNWSAALLGRHGAALLRRQIRLQPRRRAAAPKVAAPRSPFGGRDHVRTRALEKNPAGAIPRGGCRRGKEWGENAATGRGP